MSVIDSAVRTLKKLSQSILLGPIQPVGRKPRNDRSRPTFVVIQVVKYEDRIVSAQKLPSYSTLPSILFMFVICVNVLRMRKVVG